MFFTAEHNLLYPAMGVRNGPISCYDQLMWHGRHLQMGDYYTKWIWTALFPWLVPSTLDNSNTYCNDNNDSFFLFIISAGIKKSQQNFFCPELEKRVNKSCFLVARKFLRQTTLDKIDEGTTKIFLHRIKEKSEQKLFFSGKKSSKANNGRKNRWR